MLWGLRRLLAVACSSSGTGVCHGAVVSCIVVLQVCGAACVPCLACIWCARLAPACCGAGAGTHPCPDEPVWPCGGLSWCPATASARNSGVCACGGGGSDPFFCGSPPLALPSRFASLPYSPSLCCGCPLCWVWLGWARLVVSAMVGLSCAAAWAWFVLGVGCSLVCTLGVLRCVCGVLGHWALVHRCARSMHCVVCAVSLATWLLFF